MTVKERIIKNISQIIALIEKNLKLKTRFKLSLLISFITPIIGIIMPVIIMGKLFEFNEQFGSWTERNFLVYQFCAYNIILLQRIITVFPGEFRTEKYWGTLQALMIGPFNRFNLLLGILFSHLVLIIIPFMIFFVWCYIYYPISVLTLLFVILIYFLIALVFSGVGLILGILVISKENLLGTISFCITFLFYFSCITYPFDIFPEIIQNFISLNPLYYIFDLLRLSWIEDNVLLSIEKYFINLLILISFSIILPIIGIFIFNYFYKKHGIRGY